MELEISGETQSKILLAAGALVIVSVLILLLSDLILMTFLVLLSFGISLLLRMTQVKSIGIEIATLVTIVTGFVYGSTWGAVMGLLLMGFHLFVSQYIGPYILWVLPEYALLGMAAGALSSSGIVTFGIYSIIIINVFNITMTVLLHRSNLGRFAMFAVTHVIINILLISAFGPLLLGLLR